MSSKIGDERGPKRVKRIFIFFLFRQLSKRVKIKTLDSKAILDGLRMRQAKGGERVNRRRLTVGKIRD
ncbi:hypothetical protein PZN02_000850 [Sinorhizobium garamanticum]|uniref:Uncharacterized protein n=1 Tax=Sinorhizobium garamanticum TaxID=680247 RepID=A0ABY8DBV3_9HYPH|nr:hypothetical protein [Sinorhizobium garamanticum]WEX88371.1 hypothetical protein PZN02_000850 [Sinorhizobium garamanticum]